MSLVIAHSQNAELMEREKVYLNKLNVILVQVSFIFFISNELDFVDLDIKTWMAKEMAKLY